MLKLRPLIIILSLFFILFSDIAQSQPTQEQPIPQSKSKELTQQKTSSQQKPPVQFVTIQQLIDAITRTIDASYEKNKAYQSPSPPNDSSGLFQLLLTIFTGGLVIVGGVQCYIIFKTLKETQKAANAARDSADALKSAERANLFIMVQHTEDTPNVKWFCEFIVFNAGRTPAILTNVNGSYEKIAHGDTIPNISPEGDHGITPDTIIIAGSPGIDDTKSFRAKKSQAFNIDYRLVCIGRIQYKDIFGASHETGFCWEYIHDITEWQPINDPKCNYHT